MQYDLNDKNLSGIFEQIKLNISKPTLVYFECVLIYLPMDTVTCLLKQLAEIF